MPGATLYRIAEEDNLADFIKKNFQKRECDVFLVSNQETPTTEFCKCGHSKNAHGPGATQTESSQTETIATDVFSRQDFVQSELSTKTSETDAFGRLDFIGDGIIDKKVESKNKRYIRLDYKTEEDKISELFRKWDMVEPDLILSVLSDSDSSTKKSNKKTESNSLASDIYRSIVDIAVSTNAWILTGGLKAGVDELIGNEVKQRLANKDKIPKVVLGVANWGRLKEKKALLSDPIVSSGYASDNNPDGVSLDEHHTHFLLVDDGTQMRSGSECNIRLTVETKLVEKDAGEGTSKPFIYILIGGGINAIHFVERALSNRIPAIIVTGTGGAADIISEEVGFTEQSKDYTLEHLPEIFERLFHRLGKLMTLDANVRDVIDKIKANVKLKTFFEITKLLSKPRIFENDIITAMENGDTEEILSGMKELLISEQELYDHLPDSAEFYKVKRMHALVTQMLVHNGLRTEMVKGVVDKLEPSVLKEMLARTSAVFTSLNAIGTSNRKELLIKFDISNKRTKSLNSAIVEALKTSRENSEMYMLTAAWDMEDAFKQLLLENWLERDHQELFWELSKRGKTKYVKLILGRTCMSDIDWLEKPQGPLVEELKKDEWKYLMKQIKDPDTKKDHEDKHRRMMAKMIFISCIRNQMPETAMLFWRQGQDCLAMALFAYDESKKQKENLTDKEERDKMEKHIEDFSTLAIDFLTKCFADDNGNTCYLLVGKVEDLLDKTPLQIAVDADFTTFLSQVPVQELLHKIWVKDINNHSTYMYVPMLLSEACPLLAPMLLEFKERPYYSNKLLSEACPLCAPILRDNGKQASEDSKPKKQKCTSAEHCVRVRSYFTKVGSFLDTPFVKFFYGFIFFIAYLILFSTVLLTDFRTKMSPSEIVLHCFTLILILEEVQQVIVHRKSYIGDKWNFLDIGALIIYITGFIVRILYRGDPTICPDCLYVARIILAFSLLVFFFRALQFLSIFEIIGTTIYMMRRLIPDLVSFMLVLTVFISAYGVVSNVILYPNQPLNGKLLQDVFYDAWWSLVLQFNRDDALGLNCNMDNPSAAISAEYCSNSSNGNTDYVSCKQNRCPANTWIVSVLLAFYAFLTVILMLNVLIAMFVYSFSSMDEKHKEASKMQRYRLIREYSSRLMVPPPLVVITYPYYIIKYAYHLWKRCHKDEHRDSHADNANNESASNDKDENRSKTGKEDQKDVEVDLGPEPFAMNLDPGVNEWEQNMAEEFCKIKTDEEERSVVRTETQKPNTDMFPETPNHPYDTPLTRYIIEQVRKKVAET